MSQFISVNRNNGKLSAGSEVIVGTDLSDYISPLGGSDFIDGKKGYDTAYVFWPSTNLILQPFKALPIWMPYQGPQEVIS